MKSKFRALYSSTKPTGDGDCPEEIRLAKQAIIAIRDHCSMGEIDDRIDNDANGEGEDATATATGTNGGSPSGRRAANGGSGPGESPSGRAANCANGANGGTGGNFGKRKRIDNDLKSNLALAFSPEQKDRQETMQILQNELQYVRQQLSDANMQREQMRTDMSKLIAENGKFLADIGMLRSSLDHNKETIQSLQSSIYQTSTPSCTERGASTAGNDTSGREGQSPEHVGFGEEVVGYEDLKRKRLN